MSSSTNHETTSTRRPLPGWGRDSSQVEEALNGSPDAPQAPVGNTTGQRTPLPGWSISPISDAPTDSAFEFQSFPEGDDAPDAVTETTPDADSVSLEPARASRAALPGWSANPAPNARAVSEIPLTAGNETISGEAVSNSRFLTGSAPSTCLNADDAEPAVDFIPVATLVTDVAPRRRRRAELLGLGAIFSIALHFVAATLLATASYDLWSEPLRNWVEARLETEVPLELPELEIADVELADPVERETASGLAINAQSVGAEKSAIAEQKMAPLTFLDAIDIETVAPRAMFDIPAGLEIDQRIVVQGTTGDSLVEVEAALDRITHEIATQLQESKVLVVWLLDASDSLKSQRTRIADRLDRVYRELGALEENGRVLPHHDQGLTSAVVAYGNQTTFLTNEPTSEFERVRKAVRSVPSDPTGVENVFTAVEQVLKRWGKLRTTESRNVMLVVVTDETGDDFAELERSILLCRHTGAKAYVVGPSAIFGRRQGFVPYVAPEDGKTYQLPA
ncbi:MAG: VWA domain-containing protein [Planctomycetota bacterium]|nr:VWA domain-containing protein [Planctomycetota bacterium]